MCPHSPWRPPAPHMGWEDPASLAPTQTGNREPLLSSLGVHPHSPLLSLGLSSVHLPLGCETRLKEETENQGSLSRAALAFKAHTEAQGFPSPPLPSVLLARDLISIRQIHLLSSCRLSSISSGWRATPVTPPVSPGEEMACFIKR